MIGIVVQMRLLQYLLTLVVCHNELQARPLLYVVSWPLASSPLQNIFTKKLPQEVDINVTEVETSWGVWCRAAIPQILGWG